MQRHVRLLVLPQIEGDAGERPNELNPQGERFAALKVNDHLKRVEEDKRDCQGDSGWQKVRDAEVFLGVYEKASEYTPQEQNDNLHQDGVSVVTFTPGDLARPSNGPRE